MNNPTELFNSTSGIESIEASPSSRSERRRKSVDPCLMTRRRVIQGGAAIVATSLLPNVACASPVPPNLATSAILTNPQPVPSGLISNATLSVAATSVGSIPAYFNGLSFEKTRSATNSFRGSNTGMIALFNRLGPGVIRFGGVTVDSNVWNASGPGYQGANSGGTIAPTDVNGVRDFVTATGYKCLWGVNLNGATTASLAAEEAAYVYEQLGASLIGIEIGNEPESYGMTQSAFGIKWKQYRDAIVTASPGIPISAPVSGRIAWTTWFANSSGYGDLVQSLSQHYYRANSTTAAATVSNIVNPEPEPNLASILTQITSDATNLGIPYRIAECNSASGGGVAGVSNAYAAALWGVEYLLQLAQAGAAGANFHGGSSTMYYSAITMYSAGTPSSVWPLYYSMYLFQMLGTGSLYTTSFSGNSWTRAYAVKVSSSNLKILVVNTDSSHNLDLTISLYTPAQSATLIEMSQLSSGATGPSLSATDGVMIQGGAIGTDGSYSPQSAYDLSCNGSQITCYVPYLSACLIDVAI